MEFYPESWHELCIVQSELYVGF